MQTAGGVIHTILMLCVLLLIARFVVDTVQAFAPSWRPKGPVLVVLEALYTITDPPLKAVRKIIPPLRLGSVALDLSGLVVLLLIYVLMYVSDTIFYA